MKLEKKLISLKSAKKLKELGFNIPTYYAYSPLGHIYCCGDLVDYNNYEDVLNQIFAKYFKMSIGNAILCTDGLIIFSSLFVFCWDKFIYSIVNMYIISVMTDKVILGVSNSKAFYIITEHETSVKKFLLNGLSHGVTVLEGRGGYTGNNQKVIMCIVPTKEYFVVKEVIHEIDPEAFFLVTDSYEVYGGE